MTHPVQDEAFLPCNVSPDEPITRTDENKTITNDSKSHCTAYGSNIIKINNNLNKDNSYVWYLQINKFSINSMVFIGIDESSSKNSSNPYALQNTTKNYAYAQHKADSSCIYSCNERIAEVKPFGDGDIITMILNTAKNTLKYELNNKFAYKICNIDTTKQYRLAVYVQRSSVTIYDFEFRIIQVSSDDNKSESEEKELETYSFPSSIGNMLSVDRQSISSSVNINQALPIAPSVSKYHRKYINLQTEIHTLKMQRRQIKIQHLNERKSLNKINTKLKSTVEKEKSKICLVEQKVETLQKQLNGAENPFLQKQLTQNQLILDEKIESENSLEKQLEQTQRILAAEMENQIYLEKQLQEKQTILDQKIENANNLEKELSRKQTILDQKIENENHLEKQLQQKQIIHLEKQLSQKIIMSELKQKSVVLESELNEIKNGNIDIKDSKKNEINKYEQLIKEKDAINMELQSKLDNINRENNELKMRINYTNGREHERQQPIFVETAAHDNEYRDKYDTQKQRILDEKIETMTQLKQTIIRNKYIFWAVALVLLCIIIGLFHHQMKLNQQLHTNNVCDNYMTQIEQLNDSWQTEQSDHEFVTQCNILKISYNKLKGEYTHLNDEFIQLERVYNELQYDKIQLKYMCNQSESEYNILESEHYQLKYQMNELKNSCIIDNFAPDNFTPEYNQLQYAEINIKYVILEENDNELMSDYKMSNDLIDINAKGDHERMSNDVIDINTNINTKLNHKPILNTNNNKNNLCLTKDYLLFTQETHNICEINETLNNLAQRSEINELLEFKRNYKYVTSKYNLLQHNMNSLHIKCETLDIECQQLKNRNKRNVNMLCMTIMVILVSVAVFFGQYKKHKTLSDKNDIVLNIEHGIGQQSILHENKNDTLLSNMYNDDDYKRQNILVDENKKLMTRNNALNIRIGSMEQNFNDKIGFMENEKKTNNEKNEKLKNKIVNMENELAEQYGETSDSDYGWLSWSSCQRIAIGAVIGGYGVYKMLKKASRSFR